MNHNKKLIELFIYIIIVVVGIILLITSNVQKEKGNEGVQMGGAYHAAVLDEQ